MQIQSEYHRYYLTACIKQHKYGTVYQGRAKDGYQPDAVVKIFSIQLTSLRDRQRFLQEVNSHASLRHPALLPILETGIDKGNPYLIREYAPAGSLNTLLTQQKGEALPLPSAMDILTRIGMAVTYLHEQGIGHGSIKRENILFDEHEQAFLSDIRITSVLSDMPSTTHKLVMTSKELETDSVVQDDIRNTIQNDIYAFSSIAYELLTGHRPFASSSERNTAPTPPSHWIPSLSKQVDQVLLRALSPQPEERFSNVRRLVDALYDAFNTFIEEEDAVLAKGQSQILLLPPAKQQIPLAIPKQFDRQRLTSVLTSKWTRPSLPWPLLTKLPQLKATLTPTRLQLPSPRSLPTRLQLPSPRSLPLPSPRSLPTKLPQFVSSLTDARLQAPSPRSLLVRLSVLASLLSSAWAQLSHWSLVRLSVLVSLLSSAWARISLSRSQRTRLKRLVSKLSSAWTQLPSARPLLSRLSVLASALPAVWARLPLARSRRTRRLQIASPISSAWSRLPPPYPSSSPSVSTNKSRPTPTRPLLDLPISSDWLRLPSLASLPGNRKLTSIKLPFIVFAALLILTGILVSLFALHPSSPHTAAPNEPTQVPIIRLTAMSSENQTNPIRVSLKARKPTPTMTSHPASSPLPTIINAGFEQPNLYGGFQYTPNGFGWTFNDGSGIAGNNSFITQKTDNAPEFMQVAFIEAFSSIHQGVNFAGGTYRVSLFAAQRVSSSSTQSLSVLIDDVAIGTITPTGANYINYVTPSFTVTPGVHTLQFKGLQGGIHNTALIDAVAIIGG